MSEITATAPPRNGNGRVSAMEVMAQRLQIDPRKLQELLVKTCFRVKTGYNKQARTHDYREPDHNELAALVVLANEYGLNPLRKEIYAFLSDGAIVPVLGVDSWMKIANQHPAFNGLEYDTPPMSEWVPAGKHGKPCPQWMTVRVHIKNRDYPIEITEYLDEVMPWGRVREWDKAANKYVVVEECPYPLADDAPWNTHPKRQLRHKVTQQGIRYACNAGGLYSEDEAERMLSREDDIQGELAPPDINALVQQPQQPGALPAPGQASVLPIPTQAAPVYEAATSPQTAAPQAAQATQAAPAEATGLSKLAEQLAGQIMASTSEGWLATLPETLKSNALLTDVERGGLWQLVDIRTVQLKAEAENASDAPEKPKRSRGKKKEDPPPKEEAPAAPAAPAQTSAASDTPLHRGQPDPTPMEERHKSVVVALKSASTMETLTNVFNKFMAERPNYTLEGQNLIKDAFHLRRMDLGYKDEDERPSTVGKSVTDLALEPWEVLDKESGTVLTGLDALRATLAGCQKRAQVDWVVAQMTPDGHRYQIPEEDFRKAEGLIRDKFLSTPDGEGKHPSIKDLNNIITAMRLS